MNKTIYKISEEKLKADIILKEIFKSSSVKYGLKEFQNIDILKGIKFFEKEKDKIYIRCLKRDKNNSGEYIFVDENGKRVKSEEGIFKNPNIKLDDDLDEIAEAFVKFAKKQKFSFWR